MARRGPGSANGWSRRASPARASRGGLGAGPLARDELVPEEVALAFHPRTLGQLLFVRSASGSTSGRDRFLAAAHRPGSCTARARATSRSSCPTRSAWRRATCATSPRARRSSRPNGTCSTASPPSSTACTGHRCRRRPAWRSWATPGTSPAGARQALREHGLPGARPARGDQPALSPGREVRLLQLAPDLVPGLRRARDRRDAR